MRLHLAPVSLVYIGRQHHQAVATKIRGCFREGYRLRRGERGDRSNDWPAFADSLHTCTQNLQLLIECQSSALAKRTESNDTCAAVVQEPGTVFRQKAMVN